MKIVQALFVSGYSAFYFDDQHAIKQGAQLDGFVYRGDAHTQGFQAIRQAGECVSILLQLDDGSVAVGDCAAVQYSGAGGRDPLFTAQNYIPFLQKYLRPLLEGLNVDAFVPNARFFDNLKIEGQPLHTAIRYGVSQALLEATALAKRQLKAAVLCQEYKLPRIPQPVPMFGQSGDDRYLGADKMILKKVDVLPHGLINSPSKLGRHGEKLRDYVQWLTERIGQLGNDGRQDYPNYQPDLHLDVYGTLGLVFDHDHKRVAEYIAELQDLTGDLKLYIEGPVDAGGKLEQMEAMAGIKEHLNAISSPAKLVADEWCNTLQDIRDFADADCCHMVQIKTPDLGSIHNVVEAIGYCQQNTVEAYQGGTCNETDLSARTCVHVALAARPERLLIKPGMGFDEGMNVVNNEMQRAIAQFAASTPLFPSIEHQNPGHFHAH
ncbi:methylaspartate ammonia-lyase [Pseudomaricurvus alkylphenolicus]|jgi:methylaspartate ammonia-lyase|uniref:methylaspartate ammonia-lyase n=1 Tax=Pseudomaricurvus alkylphenolicus TaxID=1306991 RepID=UPI00142101BA|nr:methylaspartate ammonia-lyase [Pseudomaricurvus alkylphenolicus]NIB42157.1 methylaspartate ammonia-lyase [Pseudomaricurvus alkylphenolicus]